ATITVTVMDGCGNMGVATYSTRIDGTPPTVVTGTIAACYPSVAAAEAAALLATTETDNCPGPLTEVAATVGTCAATITVTVRDGCGNTGIATYTTRIDGTPPIIICPANISVSCVSQAPVNTATVTATDNCGPVTPVFVSDVLSNQRCPNGVTITRTYQTTDACGNVAQCAQIITVNDQTPPLLTCPANVTVSCTSQVPAANPASLTTSDNCGGAATTTFIGEVISNQVCANQYTITRTYQAMDACGNTARCTHTITVNDQTAPVFTVLPQNLAIECVVGSDFETALATWLAAFGHVQVTDECGAGFLTAVVLVSVAPEVCGPNTFVRTYEFRATDACGNTASAQATFSVVDTTPPVIICPPGNYFLTCEHDLPAPDLSLVQASDNCDENLIITVNISSVGSGCVDWIRSVNYWYMATDACGNMSSCDQPFQIIDSIPPIYTGPDTLDVGCVADLPGTGALTSILAPYMIDNCYDIICFGEPIGQSGANWVTYLVKVKDFCGNWTSQFTVTFVATGVCQPLCTATQTTWGNPTGVINGTSAAAAIEQFMNEYGGVTAGKLGKTITATSAVCVQGLLPGNGTTAQFSPPGHHLFSTANNCDPSSPLLNNNGTLKNKLAANVMAMQFNIWYNLAFNHRSLGVQPLAGLPDCLVDPIVLNKLAADQRTVQGLLDLSNNYLAGVWFYPQGFGDLLSEALDNLHTYWQNCQINDPCPPNVSVAGALRTELQDGLEEVEVNLIGSHPTVSPLSMFAITDAQGNYRFSNAVPMATNLTITPTKDDNPLNGVTTYDLVLISKHILGLEPLHSPYKMIAADANKSGSITTSDIVEMRKLILGIYQELPDNTSWRFVDQSFVFPNPANPFQTLFPENRTVASIQPSQMDDDFVAVKVGDVNQSAIANVQQNSEDRTAGTLFIDVNLPEADNQDGTVQAGETFDVTFRTAEAAEGFQFTLKLKGLSVTEITGSGRTSAENFGLFPEALTASVDGAQEFTVRFRATKAGKLRELLSISSEITKAEGYVLVPNDKSMAVKEIALRFNSPAGMTTSGVGFELYQNQPNPFQNRTVISFHLPTATAATLTVYDESGRTIFTQKGDFAQGYNSIAVERSVLNNSGLLYYKLETPTDVATRKMIQTK
ncbi:MAG: T9SS type A sorting domain-containing protein, partial [Saprospiraceae bacterium]|nr:T9SS type A sorting domain-containing protein [Saprospiraceae bacterium]